MASAEDLIKLYNSIQAKQVEKGVKGEKANAIRDTVRSIVAAFKATGVVELSQATLRNSVKEILAESDPEVKLDQGHFSTIISAMYETKKDTATGAVIVLTAAEKPPKVRVKKAKAKSAAE